MTPISDISEQIPTALGEEGRDEAIDAIAGDMRTLLASDVLYAQAQREIDAVLGEEAIDARIESSVFLPEPVETWLDSFQLTSTLNSFATSAGNCDPALTRGVEVAGASINGTDLVTGSENTVEPDTPLEIQAIVLNGGTADEVDVAVDVRDLAVRAARSRAPARSPGSPPGATREAAIQIEEEPRARPR